MHGSPRESEGGQAPTKLRAYWRPIVLLALVAAICVVTRAAGVSGRLGELREWIEGLGSLGPAAYVLIRAGAAIAMLPGGPVSMAAGVLFGPVAGVLWVSAGTTLGACLSFLVSRYLARETVARWVATREKFRRIDELTAQYGGIIVAVARLIPAIPFNVQNYAFGLTRVRFGTYLFWSWLCMLPGNVLVVVGTGVIIETLRKGRVPWVLIGVLAGTLAIMALLAGCVLFKLWRRKAASGMRGPQQPAERTR